MHLQRRPKPPKPIINEGEPDKGKIKASLVYEKGTKDGAHYRGDVRVNEELKVHPIHPRGPSQFPPGRVLKRTDPFAGLTFAGILQNLSQSIGRNEMRDDLGQVFSGLEEEQWSNETIPQQIVMPSVLKSSIVSKQNYKKLTSWFSVHVPKQEYLHKINISGKFVEKGERVPLRQTIVELKALIEEAIMDTTEDVETEDMRHCTSAEATRQREEESKRWHMFTGDKTRLLHGTRSRYFCGEDRIGSPFVDVDHAVATPSEMAVIESMMHGGHVLSLKAHFVDILPDLAPLSHTLVYLNVSFNELRVFPATILEMEQLICLKMRNNPLKEIPDEISKLKKLEVLCLSFNLLQSLPNGLYRLESLVELDLSHNSLQWLSSDISQLRRLKKLNLEGNELAGLPSSAAQMRRLKQLNVDSNFMHLLLWREMTRNQPQCLFDLCRTAYSRKVGDRNQFNLPEKLQKWLLKYDGLCAFCEMPIYGSGQRLIKTVLPSECPRIMREIPFIFTVCTPTCRRKLREKII
jgi:hypothetical protein